VKTSILAASHILWQPLLCCNYETVSSRVRSQFEAPAILSICMPCTIDFTQSLWHKELGVAIVFLSPPISPNVHASLNGFIYNSFIRVYILNDSRYNDIGHICLGVYEEQPHERQQCVTPPITALNGDQNETQLSTTCSALTTQYAARSINKPLPIGQRMRRAHTVPLFCLRPYIRGRAGVSARSLIQCCRSGEAVLLAVKTFTSYPV
jgi:hypothetical protein